MDSDTHTNIAVRAKILGERHRALSAMARKIEQALGTRAPLEVIRGLVRDQVRVEHPLEVVVSQLMQFMVATLCAYDAYRRQELTDVGNWIGWALSSEIGDDLEVEIETSRLQVFEKVAFIATWPELPSLRVMFFSSFFHYARARTAMRNVAQEFWPLAVLTFRNSMECAQLAQEQDVLLGSHLLEWAVKEAPDHAKEFTPEFESWSDDERVRPEVRAHFCVSMSTLAGTYSTRPAAEWASRALAEFGDVLHRSTKIQLRATVPALNNSEELNYTLAEIRTLQLEQKERLTPVSFERYAGRMLDGVMPLIRRAFLVGDYDVVISVLKAWYLPEEVNLGVEQRLLITVPFDMTGLHLLSPFKHHHVQREGQLLLETLTQYTNEFYGVAKTVAYADNSGLIVPSRPGVPQVDSIPGLEETLEETFCW